MSFAIVPSEPSSRRDKLQDSDKVIGSGRYTVASYEPGQQTVLEKNSEYTGDDPAKDYRAIIQYFDKASALKLLLVEQGDVDLAYRNLSPTDFEDLRQGGDVEVLGGKGIEIRYLVFNQALQPGDNGTHRSWRFAAVVAYTIIGRRSSTTYTAGQRSLSCNPHDPEGLGVRDRALQGRRYRTSPDPGEGEGGASKGGGRQRCWFHL